MIAGLIIYCTVLSLVSLSSHCYKLESHKRIVHNSFSQDNNVKLFELRLKNIPVDISANDQLVFEQDVSTLVPNTDISPLLGGENLGVLLWSAVCFYGVFTNGKPSDWVLPFIAKTLNMTEQAWFQDYTSGYTYTSPATVDFIRLVIFLSSGFICNEAVVILLGGDQYWGWSSGFCLLLPALLFNVSRSKLRTREDVEFENLIREEFQSFASMKLLQKSGFKCSEEKLMIVFRRSCTLCRDEKEFSDKKLKKIIRTQLGVKPLQGFYLNIEYVSQEKVNKQALEKSIKNAELLKKEYEKNLQQTNVHKTQNLQESSENNEITLLGNDFIRDT